MKNRIYLLSIALVAIMAITTNCSKEDVFLEPTPPNLEVTVDIPGGEYLPGTELVFTIKASPSDNNGVLDILNVTPSAVSEACPVFGSYAYNTSEDVTYTYVVPFVNGPININFTVTSVNPDKPNLKSTASFDYVFGVINSFTEYQSIKLFPLYGDADEKSLIRMDDGSTYTYQQSYDGSDSIKLGIDFYVSVSQDSIDGELVKRAGIYSTAAVVSGQTHIMLMWGDGDWKPHRRHTVAPNGIGLYNQIDYDAIIPEDIFVVSGVAVTEMVVGDVITFEPGLIGGYNPDGESLIRTNTPIYGAISIKEINYGTWDNGGLDGYVVFDYKFIDK